jgi:hypothetical protein
MDMMRPLLLAYPPRPPAVSFDGAAITYTDASVSETAFAVEKLVNGAWTEVPGSRVIRDLVAPNTTGEVRSFTDAWVSGDRYRVVAENTVGDTWNYANPGQNESVSGGFPAVTARSYAEIAIP